MIANVAENVVVVSTTGVHATGVLHVTIVPRMNIRVLHLTVTMKMIKTMLVGIGGGTQVLGTTEPPTDPDRITRAGPAILIVHRALMATVDMSMGLPRMIHPGPLWALCRRVKIKTMLVGIGRGTQVLGTTDPPTEPDRTIKTMLVGIGRGTQVLGTTDPPTEPDRAIKTMLVGLGRGTQVLGTTEPSTEPDRAIRADLATLIVHRALKTTVCTPPRTIHPGLMLALCRVTGRILLLTLQDSAVTPRMYLALSAITLLRWRTSSSKPW
jgi:hypothetical protein